MHVPKVLVIGGSDCSGRTGLEADQKTLAAHGVYALTATTALTAQNTLGVQDVHNTPSTFVAKQIQFILDDADVEVIKIGMLASAETITAICHTLKQHEEKSGSRFKTILDPSILSTYGTRLLPDDAVRQLRTVLLPSTFLLSLTIPEATLLLQNANIEHQPPSSLQDLISLAKQIHSLGPEYILLKGNHLPLHTRTKQIATPSDPDSSKITTNIFFYQSKNGIDFHTAFESPYLPSFPTTIGEGDTLASAIAAQLAHFLTPDNVEFSSDVYHICQGALKYLSDGIATSNTIPLSNNGPNPIDHFHSIQRTLFPAGGFIPYLLSHALIRGIWNRYTHHAFSNQFANGTLPPEQFKSYLIQDYLALTHFARTYAHVITTSSKSCSTSITTRCAAMSQHINSEIEFSLTLITSNFYLTKSQIESSATSSSHSILDDVNISSDILSLSIAHLPRLIGFGTIAERLHVEGVTSLTHNETTLTMAPSERDTEQGHRQGHRRGGDENDDIYSHWIDHYTSPSHQEAVKTGKELVESMIEQQGFRGAMGKVRDLVDIFRRATKMQMRLWEEGEGEGVEEGDEDDDDDDDVDFGFGLFD